MLISSVPGPCNGVMFVARSDQARSGQAGPGLEQGLAVQVSDKTLSGLSYIAPPKPALPGHEESYHPPPEYLPSEVWPQDSVREHADADARSQRNKRGLVQALSSSTHCPGTLLSGESDPVIPGLDTILLWAIWRAPVHPKP